MEQETQEQTNKFNNKIYYIFPEFSGKNVQGIIRGILPIGVAFKKTIPNGSYEGKESSQYDFYVSPKLLWEYTGIIYKE